MSLESFIFKDFSGGWNTRDGPFELADNESPDLLNVTLTTRGALTKRGGKIQFDTAGFPAGKRAEHSRIWYPGASRFLMFSIDGTIYSCTTAGALTSRVVGTAGAHWHMEDMQAADGTQYLWAANGVDLPRRISTAFAVTNWTDATGVANIAAPVNQMRVWRNRMVIAFEPSTVTTSKRRLVFSAIANPESFGDNDFLDIKTSDDDFEGITWMENLQDNLLIFKKNGLFSLYAEPPSPAFKFLGSPGCEGRFQTCVVEGRCYFWSRTGLWSTDGVEAPVYEMGPIENFIRERMNHARHAQVRVFAGRDRRVFVSMPLDTSVENNCLLELVPYLNSGEEGGPWVRHDLPVASACTYRPSDVDKVIAGAANDDELHTLFEGGDDDGVPISSYWQSSWKGLTETEKYERLRRLNIQMDGKATAKVYGDFALVQSYTAELQVATASDPLWDGGTWDGGLWNSPGGAEMMRARPETRFRFHSIRLENADPVEPMDIVAVEMMVRGQVEH